ncbi:Phage protein, Gp66 (IR5) [Pectobacterium sp. F1-1]|nr:Phage protein, Gp66 (IR5) [Pectobacterium sp. F1-1]
MTQVTDQHIEQEIQAKGLIAPRVTPEHIEGIIVSEHYFTGAQGDAKAVQDAAFSGGAINAAALRATPELLKHLTFCILVLRNGFTVTGESACVSPENFDAEIGRKIAHQNAVNKIWQLEGYLLKQRLYEQSLSEPLPKLGGCCDDKQEIERRNIEHAARTAHEVNRAYCAALGDHSQPNWEDAPDWQKNSAIEGVVFHLNGDHPPEASHNKWLEFKKQDGWKYGPVKDAEKKEHPCFVPYDQLPKEQQVKDYLFRAVVHAFK